MKNTINTGNQEELVFSRTLLTQVIFNEKEEPDDSVEDDDAEEIDEEDYEVDRR
ncbi:MAG: hypothetical protein ACLTS6_07030 [Anaerobutyricum sp.]